MAIRLIAGGAAFTIYAWVEGEHCNYLELIARLSTDSNPDAIAMTLLVDSVAHNGPPQNKEKCRKLTGNIWELKASNTTRVLWFYDKNRIIVCTHGFTGKRGKGKTPQTEINKAERIRDKYLTETRTK